MSKYCKVYGQQTHYVNQSNLVLKRGETEWFSGVDKSQFFVKMTFPAVPTRIKHFNIVKMVVGDRHIRLPSRSFGKKRKNASIQRLAQHAVLQEIQQDEDNDDEILLI
jgi:hypothetical protein